MASLVGPPKGRRFGRGGAATVTRVLEALRADCRARAQRRLGGGGSAAGGERLPEGKGEDSEDALLGTITVPLVEVRDDQLDAAAQEEGAEGCFLAGCGYDSFILDDYSRCVTGRGVIEFCHLVPPPEIVTSSPSPSPITHHPSPITTTITHHPSPSPPPPIG